MGRALLSSLHRRRAAREGTVGLFLLALVAALAVPAAASAAVVGQFEIDGNQADPDPGDPLDWATANPPSVARNDFDDAFGNQADDVFTGSKNDEPAGWGFDPAGSAPQKGDIQNGSVAFRVLEVDGAPHQFAYMMFNVVSDDGSVHMDFEFNQSTSAFTRSDGDMIIALDKSGSNLLVRVFEWDDSGVFVEKIFPATAFAGILASNAQGGNFGEAAIDLTVATGTTPICNGFHQVWMKTRSAASVSSALKDHTEQRPLVVCDDGNACTSDVCDDMAPAICVYTDISDQCDDGASCTSDSCNPSSGCVATPIPGSCGDGNVCTDDSCDPDASGADPETGCVADPNGVGCDDGLFCNGADVCAGGQCGHAGDPCLGHGECADDCHEATDSCNDPNGTACGSPGSSPCDSPDTCDGAGNCQPNPVGSNVICRPAANDCDVAEFCDGAGSCPATNTFKPLGSGCGNPGDAACDDPDTCDGAGTCLANLEQPGTPCRQGSGDQCDPDEFCDGTSRDCPSDVIKPSSAVCNPGSGDLCDPTENCTGIAGQACPADTVASAGTVCNAGTGDLCDPDELCSGIADQKCPTDTVAGAGTVCNPGSGDLCDADEVCSGTADQKCPTDTVAAAGTVCNPGSGDLCDPDEVCSGTADQACPTDTVAGGGTVCNPGSGDLCDPDEVCSGTADQKCPTDTVAGAGTICNPGSGDLCDPDEVCSGTADQPCPTDTVAAAGTVCNPGSGDLCDPDEVCSGTADQVCPTDTVTGAGTVCNPGSGDLCDPDEVCSGTADQKCPTDTVAGAGTVCNPGSGDLCDPDEVCSGTADRACPSDSVATSATVCRPSNGSVCDPQENCTGAAEATCPPDQFAAVDTSCENEDQIDCTRDLCNGSGGCVSTPDDSRCDDNGNDCTANACSPGPNADDMGCVFTPLANEPDSSVGSNSRAYGLSLDASALNDLLPLTTGPLLVDPTPDSDATNPGEALQVPAAPLAVVDALTVEESTSSGTDDQGDPTIQSSATAETLKAQLLFNPTATVVADEIKVVANCEANSGGARSDSDGSVITGLVIGGVNIGTVKKTDQPLKLDTPFGTAEVHVLEEIRQGAAAGDPQPQDGAFSTKLEVNGIHVRIAGTDGSTVVDLVVGHAECAASFSGACEEFPHVSGRGLVVGAKVDAEPIDPQKPIVDVKVGEVILPSTGGSDETEPKTVGEIGDGTNTLVVAGVGTASTKGTVDKAANTAFSTTHVQLASVDVLDTGAEPTNPLIHVDAVTSDCASTASGGGSSSTGNATLAGVSIGGNDVCAALMLEPLCKPGPNTEILPSDSGAPVLIRLNEQYCGDQAPPAGVAPSCTGPEGITVNAIHVFVLGEGNPLGLPVGAEFVVSSAHCDSAAVPTE